MDEVHDYCWSAPPGPHAGVDERMAWCAEVARWAPSKHNTQPWRFLVRNGTLEVWADAMRILPETDPHRRELTLSCGAALETARVAAHAVGREVRVVLLTAGGGPLARLEDSGAHVRTEDDQRLLEAVAQRRTDRGPLDAAGLPPALPVALQDTATALGATLRLVSTPGDRAALAALVAKADRLLVRRAHVDEELAAWLREPGDRRDDGVPTDHTRGPAASYRAEFVQRDFSGPAGGPDRPSSRPDRPLVAVLCTAADLQQDWLTAGRALAAVLLRATVSGAGASYLNQPVEDVASRVALRDQLRLPGPAQLVLRMGLGSRPAPTPRRPVDEVRFQVAGARPARPDVP
jgi:nitroreductase